VAPAFVAVPMLPVLAAGVGASARLQLKRSWREPSTLWTTVVAPSGSTKSAALQHILRPVHRREREAQAAHQEALARYDPSGNAPRPTRTRYRTGDPTTEAVVRILEDNPQGVLLEGNITVSTPAVPLTGTIQPRTLQKKLSMLHFQSGFASRLLLCRPPTTAKQWTEADVSAELEDRYRALLGSLYGLEERREEGTPLTVTLMPAAKERWIAFYNEANEQLHREHNGPARSARAKSINHAARLGLIFHLCRRAGSAEIGAVQQPVLDRAIRVAQWGLRETLRVYETLGLGTECLDPPERFLQQLPSTFSTAEAKEAAEAEDVARRTLFKWLKELQSDGLLTKVRRGQYQKTEAAP